MPAPLIAAAVAGIGTYLAKNGLDLLAGIFRGAVDSGTEQVAQLIEEKTGIDINRAAEDRGLTQEELVKLKQFELQNQDLLTKHSEAVEALALERDKALLADRANARTMQTSALSSSDEYVRRFVYRYAVLLTVLSFGFIFAVLFNGSLLTTANKDLVNTIVGFLLGTTMSAVIGFFYGSSKGSSDKAEQILALTSRPNAAAVRSATDD